MKAAQSVKSVIWVKLLNCFLKEPLFLNKKENKNLNIMCLSL